MKPDGVRLQCPECTFSTVVTEEHMVGESAPLPTGVNKRIEGEFFCPNCNVPMKPIASVETRTGPALIKPDEMTMEQWREKLGELERECEQSETTLKRARERAKDAKEDYDAKVVTLRTALRRFTHGVTDDPKPLLDIAEDEDGDADADTDACAALSPTGVMCDRPQGHEGDHRAQGQDDTEDAETWPQTAIEQAAALAPDEAVETPRYPRRGRRKAAPPAETETTSASA